MIKQDFKEKLRVMTLIRFQLRQHFLTVQHLAVMNELQKISHETAHFIKWGN